MPKKKKNCKGPERLGVNHSKDRNSVFISFYDGVLSGTLEITPEQAINIGLMGKMAQTYREQMEEVAEVKKDG
jgi:hypothetical protein